MKLRLRDKHLESIIISLISGFVGALICLFVLVFGLWYTKLGPKFLGQGIINTASMPSVITHSEHDSEVISAVNKAMPAVVSISISQNVAVDQYQSDVPSGNGMNDYMQNLFEQLFGQKYQAPTQQQEQGSQNQQTKKLEVGGGSGFFVTSDGLLITNKHVVDLEGAEYTVITSEGKKYPAKVVARDPVLDLAVLKVEGKNFPTLSFADSSTLQVGQTAIAIGNSLGQKNTVSVGVISGLGRSIVAADQQGYENLDEVVQTDAAINPGNSGGPLLDLDGNVVGINVAIVDGSQSVGFALQSNSVRGVVESVEQHGTIVRPYLGVRYVEITDESKARNKLPVNYGALVLRGDTQDDFAVVPGSPADKAGIVENDIILEVDGVTIDSEHRLTSIVNSHKIDDILNLTVLHRGDQIHVRVRLEAIPQ